MIKLPQKNSSLLYLFLGSLGFLYILIRAVSLGVTFDESTTLGVYVPQSLSAIYSYFTLMANNHWLNTLSIKLLYALTGVETLFLARVPNVLAMLSFLYYSYRICHEYLKGIWGVLLFAVLLLNPFLLDFFSLARGYGLALGMMMPGIFYLLAFAKSNTEKDGIIALCFAAVSVLCNFSMLFFFTGMYAVVHLLAYVNKKNDIFSFALKSNLISISLLALISYPLKKLRDGNELWYGGTEGFYKSSLTSLVDSTMGFNKNPEKVAMVLNGFLVLFFAAFIFSFLSNKKDAKYLLKPSIILMLLLAVTAGANVFLHLFFDVRYLIHRTALFYFPLFLMAFVFLISDNNHRYSLYFMRGSFVVILALSLVNFKNHYNYYKTITFFYDAPTTKVLDYIEAKGKAENKIFILDSTAIFKGSLRYYFWKKKYKHYVYIKEQPDNLDESLADYFLYLTKPLPDLNYIPEKEEVVEYPRPVVLRFEEEGVVLLSNFRKSK